MTTNRGRGGFTLTDLVALLIVLIVVSVLALAACSKEEKKAKASPSVPNLAAQKRKNGLQLNAVAKSWNIWSETFYQQTLDLPRTGLVPPPPNYTIASNAPTDRMGALCNMGAEPLDPAKLINPVGTDVVAKGTPPHIVLHANNLSYALLKASNYEWKNRIEARVPLGCDKQVGSGSFWNPKTWEGCVVWGDAHVTYEPSSKVETVVLGEMHSADDLWKQEGERDVLMENP